jgi:hypothetical protein
MTNDVAIDPNEIREVSIDELDRAGGGLAPVAVGLLIGGAVILGVAAGFAVAYYISH